MIENSGPKPVKKIDLLFSLSALYELIYFYLFCTNILFDSCYLYLFGSYALLLTSLCPSLDEIEYPNY